MTSFNVLYTVYSDSIAQSFFDTSNTDDDWPELPETSSFSIDVDSASIDGRSCSSCLWKVIASGLYVGPEIGGLSEFPVMKIFRCSVVGGRFHISSARSSYLRIVLHSFFSIILL